jgi:hypothetical protein
MAQESRNFQRKTGQPPHRQLSNDSCFARLDAGPSLLGLATLRAIQNLYVLWRVSQDVVATIEYPICERKIFLHRLGAIKITGIISDAAIKDFEVFSLQWDVVDGTKPLVIFFRRRAFYLAASDRENKQEQPEEINRPFHL